MRRYLIVGLLAAQAWAQTDTETYFVAFLRPDPARTLLAREEGARIQTAHMANIHKMADDGYLVAAGPFDGTPTTISGVFIMKAASLEEARRIANQDPTVTAKRNTIDVHVWQGPAGVGAEYQRLHKADPKTPDDMGLHPIAFLRRGQKWSENSANANSITDGPLGGKQAIDAALQNLRRSGKLVAGGLIQNEDDFKAILIFERIPMKDAKKALDAIVAESEGSITAEYHQFYSAGHVFPW